MTVPYQINKYTHGINSFGTHFSIDCYSAELAATTEQTLTVPGSFNPGNTTTSNTSNVIAVFSCSNVVFTCLNQTAALPGGGTFEKSTSEMIPANYLFGKQVKSGDVIHVIAPNANTYITVTFYAFPVS